MADLKISQLTASTTPLAGTEVLPIVQSGTTKQVSVANLTAARDVAVKTLAVSSTLSAWDTTFAALDIGSRGSLASAGQTLVANNAYFNGSDWIYKATDGASFLQQVSGALSYWNAASGTAGTAISFAQKFGIDVNGNTTLNTGNLVIGTSGKGIDFSATPGTGTSELLADYEEGTWTPGLDFGGATTGITFTAQEAVYTKVGRLVHVSGRFSLSSKGSATGTASITGLPYAIAGTFAALSGGVVAWYVNMALVNGMSTFGNLSATTLLLNIPGVAGITNAADTNFTNTSAMYFSYTYIV